MELTKEYFDKQSKKFVTKNELKEILKNYPTKADLKDAFQEFKTEFKDELISELVSAISELIATPINQDMAKVHAVLRLENVVDDKYIVMNRPQPLAPKKNK